MEVFKLGNHYLKGIDLKNIKFNNDVEEEKRCFARLWGDGSFGNDRCERSIKVGCLCKKHFEASQRMNGGWWLGIPATSDTKDLGYKFIQYVTSKKIQAEEVSRFGILPVRKDLVFMLPEVFSEGWVGDVFKASSEQLQLNDTTVVPLIEGYPELASIYIGLWYDVVIKKYSTDVNPIKVSGTEIQKAIAEGYSEKLSKIK